MQRNRDFKSARREKLFNRLDFRIASIVDCSFDLFAIDDGAVFVYWLGERRFGRIVKKISVVVYRFGFAVFDLPVEYRGDELYFDFAFDFGIARLSDGKN